MMTEHEHGLGLSGLHRIRQQQPPSRKPTMPGSSAPSRSPSLVALSRTPSLTTVLSHASTTPLSPGLDSHNFTEDLSRFPSESLHSFSFAHQSEDFLHNRQNVIKRSLEFMKDRMGWPMNSAQVGLATAQARASGDVEAQHMLELLSRTQLTGTWNAPGSDAVFSPTSLAGPSEAGGENVFDRQFTPQSSSPEALLPADSTSPTASSDALVALPPPKFQHAYIKGPHQQRVRKATTITAAASSASGSASAGIPEAPENHTAPADHPGAPNRTLLDPVENSIKTPPPVPRPSSLKRTMTDTVQMSPEARFMDAMPPPLYQEPLSSPALTHTTGGSGSFPSPLGPSVHGHTNRWVPAAQAIFTTESKPPWTIIAANDLACLVFGVTKAEVHKMGILEVVQEERRAWLERKLLYDGEGGVEDGKRSSRPPTTPASSAASALLGGQSGASHITASSSSKHKPSKYSERRSQTVHSGDPNPPKTRGSGNHRSNRSRGVLLCGDIVPIQKRNGSTGSASIWVKEKRVGLIWVLEEIHEDTAFVELDEEGIIKRISGATQAIWGINSIKPGMDVGVLIPRIPRQGIDPNTGEIDFAQVRRRKFFTCPNPRKVSVPCTIEQQHGTLELRVSSYPHIAGMIVLDPQNLHIRSSNSVFSGALFGFDRPDGMSINALIPGFDRVLDMLTESEGIELLDGIVVTEDKFRRASGLLALREHRPDVSDVFLKPEGIPAKHRDGSELKIDVQMRVVKSEKKSNVVEETVVEESDEEDESKGNDDNFVIAKSEMVYALWITYSRQLHAEQPQISTGASPKPEEVSPPHQPSPGQTPPLHTPQEVPSEAEEETGRESGSKLVPVQKQIKDAAMNAAAKLKGSLPNAAVDRQPSSTPTRAMAPPAKKSIDDYTILEEMGQGAYGQVKLAQNKQTGKKVVLKYVTKRRILVDTWTRDRKLGTVPLEIHVLDYLSRPEFRHPNIVEMEGFFEDRTNYYIEMKPHGLPGMDLFDYIELRSNMDEAECRSIFKQVAQAIQFLHVKARVVHRDIKDENVILDGDGNIKLIDFGSAAYIKSGPFDVFVGTIGKSTPAIETLQCAC